MCESKELPVAVASMKDRVHFRIAGKLYAVGRVGDFGLFVFCYERDRFSFLSNAKALSNTDEIARMHAEIIASGDTSEIYEVVELASDKPTDPQATAEIPREIARGLRFRFSRDQIRALISRRLDEYTKQIIEAARLREKSRDHSTGSYMRAQEQATTQADQIMYYCTLSEHLADYTYELTIEELNQLFQVVNSRLKPWDET